MFKQLFIMLTHSVRHHFILCLNIYKIHLILNDIDFLEAFVPGPTSIKDLIQFETLLYMGPDSEVGTIYPLDFIIYVDGAILWNSSFSLTSTEPTGLQVFFLYSSSNSNIF